MGNKKFTLNIAFGDGIADALNGGRKLKRDEVLTHINKYEFSSENEAKAFLFGISESMGWFDYYLMDESDIQKLSKNWLKEIEVQQVT